VPPFFFLSRLPGKQAAGTQSRRICRHIPLIYKIVLKYPAALLLG